jgi:hypothetical protein
VSNRRKLARKRSPGVPPSSVEQWLHHIRNNQELGAEAKVVAEVLARHAQPDSAGGFTVVATDEVYAEAAALLRYRRTLGHGC